MCEFSHKFVVFFGFCLFLFCCVHTLTLKIVAVSVVAAVPAQLKSFCFVSESHVYL